MFFKAWRDTVLENRRERIEACKIIMNGFRDGRITRIESTALIRSDDPIVIIFGRTELSIQGVLDRGNIFPGIRSSNIQQAIEYLKHWEPRIKVVTTNPRAVAGDIKKVHIVTLAP